MWELLSGPQFWVALFSVSLVQIALGADNLIIITIIANKLPEKSRKKAIRTAVRKAAETGLIVKGGGHAIELLQYNGPEDRKAYRPRCVDVGHWHLSINIDDIDIATEEALKFGCTKVGGQITVDAGPNKGNKIQYIAAKDGMVVEMTWIANRD